MAIEILQTRKILADGGPKVGDLESSVIGSELEEGTCRLRQDCSATQFALAVLNPACNPLLNIAKGAH
jgi:hypothetical protein